MAACYKTLDFGSELDIARVEILYVAVELFIRRVEKGDPLVLKNYSSLSDHRGIEAVIYPSITICYSRNAKTLGTTDRRPLSTFEARSDRSTQVSVPRQSVNVRDVGCTIHAHNVSFYDRSRLRPLEADELQMAFTSMACVCFADFGLYER
ncbi:hypothetical protein J6590_045571 [Homalodisca vitripennis]|nr:hypothetical protein J6590_045571 [Homalodisca vitripennis]